MKAVIFDFDGVIVKTERQRFAAIQQVVQKKGLFLPDSEFEEMEGKKTTFFLRHQFPQLTTDEIEEISEERRNEELQNLDKVEIIKGVFEVFEFLQKKNVTIAICSGSKRNIVQGLLDLHNLTSHLKIVVTGEDFEESKPNPESYQTTLKKLHINGSDAIVVEDAPAGIEAANIAGCYTIGIETYVSKNKLIAADTSVKNHKELLKLLKNIFK